MPDWLIVYLGSLQAGIIRSLAAELRAGGVGAVALAFTLGAVHALTPGHGKAALAATSSAERRGSARGSEWRSLRRFCTCFPALPSSLCFASSSGSCHRSAVGPRRL